MRTRGRRQEPEEILVIKHGAFGDFIQALPAMSVIRAAHPGDRITLLTTRPYAALGGACGWFNRVEIDTRPEFWNLIGINKLRRQLAGYERVYDLQTSSRSSRYFRLAGRPLWSGIAPGCELPHADPNRNALHTRERLAGQLHDAGIFDIPAADLSWATRADISRFALPEAFTLLVPGASAHRPEKRWPGYAALAAALPEPCVIVGAAGEGAGIPGLDLSGQTSLLELGAIIARSKSAIGNDTGPMHLAAALGIPSTVLFSAASDPALTSPRYPDGGWPVILRSPDLAALPVAQVLAALP
ncbi:MAG: ADP-heptose--LPS heptosyltransferase [Rhodospirillales bacterium 20-64-7]|nr:MAG: ADP-heptose--LPS heptosyltransferase [Rhodospirillales bacterium 20-64-7]